MNKPILEYKFERAIFGQLLNTVCIRMQDVYVNFSVFLNNDPEYIHPFQIKGEMVRSKDGFKKEYISEEIDNVYLINTDDEFRKKFKRSYSILKIETSNTILTIGAYCDNKNKMTPDNIYLLCTTDFINLLAASEKVVSKSQLDGTPFEELSCIIDNKELAKLLLR